MNNFSQRNGLKPKLPIQKNCMSESLKNRLWNCVNDFFERGVYLNSCWGNQHLQDNIYLLWDEFFKIPTEIHIKDPRWVIPQIREKFFSYEWNTILDFIEFIAQRFNMFLDNYNSEVFIDKCNDVFKSENSAYIFDDSKIIERISDIEFESIESSIQESVDMVEYHLKKAKKFLFDRSNYDYENSIKESISAIEALCRNISGTNQQLSSILKEYLKEKHPCMQKIITQLSAYANDADAIRHSQKNNSKNNSDKATKEDALLILVTSSAIINYLNSFSRNLTTSTN